MDILVVDDEPAVVAFVERVLKLSGSRTMGTADSEHALRIADGQMFDLLVTDVVMPMLSGPQLAREVRAKHPDVRVLYFTGDSRRLFDAIPELLASEAFLDKPGGVKELLDAVSSLASRCC